MHAFTVHEGLVAPLDRSNVDTDAIIPKQFIKSIRRDGFGDNLFDEWRYLDPGQPGQDIAQRRPNPEFETKFERYRGASILLSRANFGCGSSREHAVWALENDGFRVVIASSFADIFHGNCFKNGVLPISLDAGTVDRLFGAVRDQPGYRLRVDLERQCIERPDGDAIAFSVDPFRRHCLLNGLDDIGLTLQQAPAIQAYEQRRRALEPWLFD